MIVTFRIDERLIHGQVIATWLNSLGVTHLVVANDEAAVNQKQQQILKLAVPTKVKCLIKSIDDVKRVLKDPRCEKMRIMLIVGKPEDAVPLLEEIKNINEVNFANYGSITKANIPDKLVISTMVSLDNDDINSLNKIIEFGKPVFTQKTPVEQKKYLKKIEKGN